MTTYSSIGVPFSSTSSPEKTPVQVSVENPDLKEILGGILSLLEKEDVAPIVNVESPVVNVAVAAPQVAFESPAVYPQNKVVIPNPVVNVEPKFDFSPIVQCRVIIPRSLLISLVIGIYLLLFTQAVLIFQSYYPDWPF